MTEFVKVEGTALAFAGKPLFLRGFGVGTWLNMEHFMIGLPTPDSMIRAAYAEAYGPKNADAFFAGFMDSFMAEEDFACLQSCGVNFIRVPFNYRLLLDDNTGQLREEGFARLTRLLDYCEQYKIFCMPDLHTSPGGQNPDWHSDNRTGWPQFWQFKVFRDQIVALWGEIAKRLANYSYLLGYDLLNEPAMASWDAMNSFYTDAIAEIRKHDPNHAIVLEGDGFAMDFSGLAHFSDPQVILSFHYYPTVWHPDLLDKALDREVRRQRMEEGLLKLVEIRNIYNRPIICGEAGYDLHPDDMPFCMQLLGDTLDLFEKHQVSWAIWTYKDACFMGMVHPATHSPWMQFADKVHQQWTHYGEMAQAKDITAQMAALFGGISEQLAYKAQFQVRGILYQMQQEKILLPLLQNTPWAEMEKLPASLQYANCEIYSEYAALIKSYTGAK